MVSVKLRGRMTIDQRILIDPWGAILGKGEKFEAREGMHRASNETRIVFDAWCACKPDGRLPRRSDLNLERLGALAASTMVLDVLSDPNDYRYCIVGAHQVEARVEDPTGKTVRGIYSGEVLGFCLESYDRAAASQWGLVDFSVEASANPRFLELETLFLPLSTDGETVNEILVYGHFVER
jgi:hypothetical protein